MFQSFILYILRESNLVFYPDHKSIPDMKCQTSSSNVSSSAKNRYADAPMNDDFTIDQKWETYSTEEHNRWDRLFARMAKLIDQSACQPIIEAVGKLRLSQAGIPNMERLSDRLEALTGWRVVPVAGLVPDEVFFNHLANKRFPAGAFIRPENEFDYLQEPDIFHDIYGHVPMLANPQFASFMQAYGEGGKRAMSLGQLHNLARLYWYTVEFGLIIEEDELRIFGAGIISSSLETEFSLNDRSPNRILFDVERIMRTKYIIDDFQQTYFVIHSFDQLLEACYEDFGAHYATVVSQSDIEASNLIDCDQILNKGTLEYFNKESLPA